MSNDGITDDLIQGECHGFIVHNHSRHVELGGRMVPFAGWEMPYNMGLKQFFMSAMR